MIKNSGAFVLQIPTERRDCHMIPEEGSILCEKPGICKYNFNFRQINCSSESDAKSTSNQFHLCLSRYSSFWQFIQLDKKQKNFLQCGNFYIYRELVPEVIQHRALYKVFTRRSDCSANVWIKAGNTERNGHWWKLHLFSSQSESLAFSVAYYFLERVT